MEESLSGCGSTIMASAVDSQDRLGWDCFVEGQISKVFLEVIKPALSDHCSHITPECWCRTFIGKLLQLTHKQWLFCNSHVHYKKLKGLTATQHTEIFERVKCHMWSDPPELLAKHKLFLEEDFELLGKGSSNVCLT